MKLLFYSFFIAMGKSAGYEIPFASKLASINSL